jgi:hypothetical protein
MALQFILESNLRQKENYGNSNISPYKNIWRTCLGTCCELGEHIENLMGTH